MFGILNVNKPAGWTSRDVVNRVQNLVRPAKVGHAGTLDPLATGVLVVCVGPATRLIADVQQMEKSYEATFLLGRTSPSEDVETEVTQLDSPVEPTVDQLKTVLPNFLGRIEQQPPIYSAIKRDGQPAYKQARKGKKVSLQPRSIEVYELTILGYEYPELRLAIRCGSGTYVRSLGRDLARAVGTEAVMSALVRRRIGEFSVDDSVNLASLTLDNLGEYLLSPLQAVPHLPKITLDEPSVRAIHHGRAVSSEQLGIPEGYDARMAAVDGNHRLVALLKTRRPGEVAPLCNFPRSE